MGTRHARDIQLTANVFLCLTQPFTYVKQIVSSIAFWGSTINSRRQTSLKHWARCTVSPNIFHSLLLDQLIYVLVWLNESNFITNLVYWYNMETFICSCGQRSQIKVKGHLRSICKITWKCKFGLICILEDQLELP